MREGDAEALASKLAEATQRVVRDYELGDVADEESFSSQLCGRLKETLYEFSTPSMVWQVDAATADSGWGRLSARSLRKHTEEPEFGADIVMAIDVNTSRYQVRKGFLAQAKRLEPGHLLDARDWSRLIRQCESMVSFTPASVVFLYSRSGVYVIPATAVLACRDQNLWRLTTHDIRQLYRDFAICWFGDLRLKTTDHASLEGLRELVSASGAIRFVGRTRPRVRLRPAR